MQLEEGKFYKTRDGRKVGPIIRTDEYSYEWPFTVEHEFRVDGIFGKAWKTNGSYSQDASEFADETAGDLIEEWRDEPKSPIEEKMILCRRIHYGDYGNLTIYESKGDLRIEFNKSKHTAEELEEAAHILVQVAEFLRSEEVKCQP